MLQLASLLFLGTLVATTGLPADVRTEDAPPARADSTWQAREEAEVGSRAFAAGDFLSAAESYGRAVALDPLQIGYGVLRARALGELVARDDLSPTNAARLRTVVSIYRELLAADPGNEEYAQSVASLLEKAGDSSARDTWLLGRARNVGLPAEIRSNALRASAESALAEAVRANADGRREAAAALAAQARQRLDEAIVISPGALACHALRLYGLELEVSIAGERKDAPRQAELEVLLLRARRTAETVERARRTAERTDEY